MDGRYEGGKEEDEDEDVKDRRMKWDVVKKECGRMGRCLVSGSKGNLLLLLWSIAILSSLVSSLLLVVCCQDQLSIPWPALACPGLPLTSSNRHSFGATDLIRTRRFNLVLPLRPINLPLDGERARNESR